MIQPGAPEMMIAKEEKTFDFLFERASIGVDGAELGCTRGMMEGREGVTESQVGMTEKPRR
jgi:hypothetical protein